MLLRCPAARPHHGRRMTTGSSTSSHKHRAGARPECRALRDQLEPQTRTGAPVQELPREGWGQLGGHAEVSPGEARRSPRRCHPVTPAAGSCPVRTRCAGTPPGAGTGVSLGGRAGPSGACGAPAPAGGGSLKADGHLPGAGTGRCIPGRGPAGAQTLRAAPRAGSR